MYRTIWKVLALVPGEKLITETSGDQRSEEAGFRHLPGIWWDFTPEYQKYTRTYTYTHSHIYIHTPQSIKHKYIHTYICI